MRSGTLVSMVTSVAQKLQVKPGDSVYVVGTPAQFALIGPLPADAVTTDDPGRADVAVVFVDDAAALEDLLAAGLETFADVRAPWLAYPKGGRSDVSRDSLWGRVQREGWRLNANVAIDDTWSAVRMKRD